VVQQPTAACTFISFFALAFFGHLHLEVHICVRVTDVNRNGMLKQVEAKNSGVIGIVCAIIVSAIFAIFIVLDLTSIKESLQLLRNNLGCSEK